jgi:hypothetical protein
MATYNPANIAEPLYSGDKGNATVQYGSATLTSASTNGDKYRPCRIAAGTKVTRVVIKNTDLDSNVSPAIVCDIGFAPMDGSAGTATAFATAATILQGAATTTYEIFPPVTVAKDSFLEVLVTTGPGTGATGTVSGKVEGECFGAK